MAGFNLITEGVTVYITDAGVQALPRNRRKLVASSDFWTWVSGTLPKRAPFGHVTHLASQGRAISQIGDTDGQFFASSSDDPARGPIPLAKKVQIKQALADAKVTDLKKREELRKPRIHDPEFSARRVRFQAEQCS
jgi:hypothetical protein